MTAPKRRWPRFSLRTLFAVLTVFCCWLGWNLQQIRERERILKVVLSYGGSTATIPDVYRTGRLPFSWRLLGARRFDFVRVPTKLYVNTSPSDLCGFEGFRRIETAFPEAKVVIGSQLQVSDPDHEEMPISAFGTKAQMGIYYTPPPKRNWFDF